MRSIATAKYVIVATLVLLVGAKPSHAELIDRKRGDALLVQVDYGALRGMQQKGVREFLGVPYAAPPVGDLRWRPPKAHSRWPGVRDATKFSAHCAQNSPLNAYAGASIAEDCLYLNVFSPNRHPGRFNDLPVMIWLHGGGLYAGESDDYDGAKLAELGQVIVVTINYRLGILGWFAQPALDAEGHAFGNYGYFDQLAAMDWIQRNIAAFGGDPKNVTLFGQSSGGDGIYASLISPKAKGLFHRGIIQSSLRLQGRPTTSLAIALDRGRDFTISVGCSRQSARCLRSLPVAKILQSQAPFLTGVIVDGAVIPRSLDASIKNGLLNTVPIMIGGVKDEAAWPTAIREIVVGRPMTLAKYSSILDRGEKISNEFTLAPPINKKKELLAAYPVKNYRSVSEAYIRLTSDARACADHYTAIALSAHMPVYMYEFSLENPPSYLPPVSFPMGAYHTSELQFLFPLYRGWSGITHQLSKPQEALSERMVRIWTDFARNGDPNGASHNGPWLRLDRGRDHFMNFDLPSFQLTSGSNFLVQHKCAFWRDKLPSSFP